MGRTHPEWSKKYETISTMMESQSSELRTLFRKILKMRCETCLVGVKCLKATKLLHQVKEEAEALQAQLDDAPSTPQ
ncbi:hypothetical protein Zmor_016753 [Zophobas morio]|uniref:Uncharacterized protein n=1 Tax=Zophobas morio TaxID=2755281 RepID=A0AA38IAY0_9CUCU|nr:hypothetical protein Zmor_016753 [Zophobas morio]